MSGGTCCRCPEREKPLPERAWVVLQRKCNHSAFNGYHETPSDWSDVGCRKCGSRWRTRAMFADLLPDSSHKPGTCWWETFIFKPDTRTSL